MNLHYLVDVKHWAIDMSEGVEPMRMKLNGEVALGVRFPASKDARLAITGGARAPHIKSGTDDIGWVAILESSMLNVHAATLDISLTDGQSRATRKIKLESGKQIPVLLPSSLELDNPFAASDLILECHSPGAPVSLITSRRVDRAPLYKLAKGTGIEIGPGPRPQIHNGPDVSVQYVEEKGAEDWLKTYKPDVSDSAWSADNYILGKASNLPVDDGSLDFIFSSHVLEHLYNPLGHLEHWRQKLKKGGYVLGVVPCLDGTKDFVLPPTTLIKLIAEQATGSFQTPPEAFHNWAASHRPHEKDPGKVAAKLMDQEFSIHVHVYDNVLATTMLRHCVEKLGFSDYAIYYKRNSKDFAFALKA